MHDRSRRTVKMVKMVKMVKIVKMALKVSIWMAGLPFLSVVLVGILGRYFWPERFSRPFIHELMERIMVDVIVFIVMFLVTLLLIWAFRGAKEKENAERK